MTVYGGNGCYADYCWRAGRGSACIFNPYGVEIGYIDPTTVDSVGAYIWNLDPYNPGRGVCKPPCTPVWICEPGQTGWEIDGCGNRRANPACNPPQIGSISFVSSPPGAEIYIDGADQGVMTPNTISSMPVGTHTYVLRLAGYNDYAGSVSVTLSQTAAVSATMITACTPVWKCELPLNGLENDGCGNRRVNPACNPPQIGNISFASTPAGAEIFIDGADQNIKTPATIYNIPVGPHIYTLKQTGYNDVTGTANVGLNQTAVASATLIPVAMPGIGTGTIMAVVLVAGALGVIYATREKKLQAARG